MPVNGCLIAESFLTDGVKMKEWILIITMRLVTQDGDLNDVQIEMIDGFTSKQRCEQAGKDISSQLIYESGRHMKQQGIAPNHKNHPSVYFICNELVK